jgi:hypothetical protein
LTNSGRCFTLADCGGLRGRGVKVVILKSALKRGVSETAINHCLLTVRSEAILIQEPEKRLIVGFDHNANPLEIIGIVDNDVLFVIHAMKLRKKYFYLLEESNGV